ncbi:MAG TPA: hypothetical protein VER55_06425 [Ardenticatenaceae bacterium]|nr:hypothetical protein [Ardenticatenaceae bacterium]
MNREELLALCEKAPAIGSVKHGEFADYIVVLEQTKRGRNGQWEKSEAAYMSVDGRVAMANEDHRRQGKALHFEDPVVLVDDEEQLTLLVAATSEIYGRRHGIATSRKLTGTSAERSFPWEVAETSAIGRALGAMGYGVLPGSGLASAEDIQRAQEAPGGDGRGQPRRGGTGPSRPAPSVTAVPSRQGAARREETLEPAGNGHTLEAHVAPVAGVQQAALPGVTARRNRPVSPFQRQKLTELYEELFPGEESETGLDELFAEQVGHGIDEATYDEGRQVTAYLLREKRAPELAATGTRS